MKVIGVTGPTGSGKSLLCDFLSKNKIPVIDADEVYHGLLIPPSPCLDALKTAFGNGILHKDGTLDRGKLSAIVFHDAQKLELLNRTVLIFVLDRIRYLIRALDRDGFSCVVVDAPTLIESGFHRECDTVISILSPAALRTERIMQRDGLTREKAEARIQAQKDDAFYENHSDYVLTNTGDAQEFFQKIPPIAKAIGLSLPLI